MPASYMFNYLVIVNSCPLLITATSSRLGMIKAQIATLLHEDGCGKFLTNFHPYYLTRRNPAGPATQLLNDTAVTTFSNKVLLHKFSPVLKCCSDYICAPVGSIDMFDESFVRVVEVIEDKISDEGLITIVELVHRRSWMNIVRFVIIGIQSVLTLVNGKAISVHRPLALNYHSLISNYKHCICPSKKRNRSPENCYTTYG